MNVVTRFAPSPTGMLHIGNARIALMNWMYAQKHHGRFILRFDDTDYERSKEEYKSSIIQDLSWLGINWNLKISQSERLSRYEEVKNILIKQEKIYPCFETIEELEVKRESSKPFIYDRYSLTLTKQQILNNIEQGKTPHYRFFIDHSKLIEWFDMVKGYIKFQGKYLCDPIVIREDGSLTYMLSSCIDDIDYNITDIIRGDDHLTNTAIQIEVFKALSTLPPKFAHIGLVQAIDRKISKRIGGFEIINLKNDLGLESITVNNFINALGRTKSTNIVYKSLEQMYQDFDLGVFSKKSVIFQPEELKLINHKILITMSYQDIRDRLIEIGMSEVDENFWLTVRPNLYALFEVKTWWKICYDPEVIVRDLDKNLLMEAENLLIEDEINIYTWSYWVERIIKKTGKGGKELFLSLRLAITGLKQGPEMSHILPLIGKKEILRRLKLSYISK